MSVHSLYIIYVEFSLLPLWISHVTEAILLDYLFFPHRRVSFEKKNKRLPKQALEEFTCGHCPSCSRPWKLLSRSGAKSRPSACLDGPGVLKEFGSGPPSGPPRLTALRPSVGTGCTISLLLGRGAKTGPKCGGTVVGDVPSFPGVHAGLGWCYPGARICSCVWSTLATVTDINAGLVHPRPISVVLILPPFFFWNHSEERLWAGVGSLLPKCSPGRMWGSQMWDGPPPSEGSSESQHRLEMNGFLIELWVCNIGLSHIQVKMPVHIRYKNWPVIIPDFLWASLKKKESFGWEGEEGLIDPRSENWMWISMATSEENLQYFKSRYHVMFQLGHTHVGHPNKR